MKEVHLSCFPGHGKINIGALMVEYDCIHYHMADSLLVGQVFKMSWNKVRAEVHVLENSSASVHSGTLAAAIGEGKLCVIPSPLIIEVPEDVQDAGCLALYNGRQDFSKEVRPENFERHAKEKDNAGLGSSSQTNCVIGTKFLSDKENFGLPLLFTQGPYTQSQSILGRAVTEIATSQKTRRGSQNCAEPTDKALGMDENCGQLQGDRILTNEAALSMYHSDMHYLNVEGKTEVTKSSVERFQELTQNVNCRDREDKTVCCGKQANSLKDIQIECKGQSKSSSGQNSKCLLDPTVLRCLLPGTESATPSPKMGSSPTEAETAVPEELGGPKLQLVDVEPSDTGHNSRKLPSVCCYAKSSDQCNIRIEDVPCLLLGSKSTERIDIQVTSQDNGKVLSKRSCLHSMSSKSASSKQEACNHCAEDVLLKLGLSSRIKSNSDSGNEMTTAFIDNVFRNDGPVTGNRERDPEDRKLGRCMGQIGQVLNEGNGNALALASIFADMVPETQESEMCTQICAAVVNKEINFESKKDIESLEQTTENSAEEGKGKPLTPFPEILGTMGDQHQSASTKVLGHKSIQPSFAGPLGFIEDAVPPKRCKKRKKRAKLVTQLTVEGNCIIDADVVDQDEQKEGDNRSIKTSSDVADLAKGEERATGDDCMLTLGKDLEESFNLPGMLLEGNMRGFCPSGSEPEDPQSNSLERIKKKSSGEISVLIKVGDCKDTPHTSTDKIVTEGRSLLNHTSNSMEGLKSRGLEVASVLIKVDNCADTLQTSGDKMVTESGRSLSKLARSKRLKEEHQQSETLGRILDQEVRKEKWKGNTSGEQNRIVSRHENHDQIPSQDYCEDREELVCIELEEGQRKKKKQKKEQDKSSICNHNNAEIEERPSKFEDIQVDESASDCSQGQSKKLVAQHKNQVLDDVNVETCLKNVEEKTGEGDTENYMVKRVKRKKSKRKCRDMAMENTLESNHVKGHLMKSNVKNVPVKPTDADSDEYVHERTRRKSKRECKDRPMASIVEDSNVKGNQGQSRGHRLCADADDAVTRMDVSMVTCKNGLDVLNTNEAGNEQQEKPPCVGRKKIKSNKKLDRVCSKAIRRVFDDDMLNLAKVPKKVRIREQDRMD